MALEQLKNLAKIGEVTPEPPAADEIAGLLRSGAEHLAAAKGGNLPIGPRFSLAYSAAHAFSLAALRIAGYRTAKRYIVFQCLRHTLNLPDKSWRILVQAHQKRNVAEYRGDTDIEEHLVKALIQTVEDVAALVSRYQAQVMPDTSPIIDP